MFYSDMYLQNINSPDDIKRVEENLISVDDYLISSSLLTVNCFECSNTERQPLSKSMIEMILKNPFYYGKFIWKGNRYKGNHEPLISRDLFNKVQCVFNTDGKSRFRKRNFLFKRFLKCGRCGCAIVGEIKKGKYIYYHCTRGKGECDQPYVREELLNEQLVEIFRAIQIDANTTHSIIETLKSSHAEECEYRESEIKRLKRRNNELQIRLDKSYEDRLDGIIDEPYWRDVSAKWRAEQGRILEQIERHQDADRSYVDQGIKILKLAQHAYSQYVRQNADEKRILLDFVLSNCTFDGVTLYPTYRKPFDLIAEGIKMQFKLPRLDSNQRPAD